MSKSSLVSVVMPAYNAGQYIYEAIQSVLCQTYQNFELLVINDGSSDETGQIILSIQDDRIKSFNQEKRGVSSARNIGLQNMKGDYFCFLDADDKLPETSLENRLKVFQKNKRIEFVDGKVVIYNSDFSQSTDYWIPDFDGDPIEDLLKLKGKAFFGLTWMIKRKKHINYQFKQGLSHGEDLLFYINLCRKGGRYSFTEEPVLFYRKGHQSTMVNIRGLENGYRSIYHEIVEMEDIPEGWEKTFLKKARKVMFKSYLGAFQPIPAFNAYFSKW